MKRLLVLLLAACAQYKTVELTFGKDGEGLQGFLCKELDGGMLLDRLAPSDSGYSNASLVADIIDIEDGQPGCRTGQLIQWCSEHRCAVTNTTRVCFSVTLPSGVTGLPREDVKQKVRDALQSDGGQPLLQDAPDKFVILRLVATSQPCDELTGSDLPAFDPKKLVGCAYSCPTLFDRAPGEVYVGFETLTAYCEQGVRICADKELHWQP